MDAVATVPRRPSETKGLIVTLSAFSVTFVVCVVAALAPKIDVDRMPTLVVLGYVVPALFAALFAVGSLVNRRRWRRFTRRCGEIAAEPLPLVPCTVWFWALPGSGDRVAGIWIGHVDPRHSDPAATTFVESHADVDLGIVHAQARGTIEAGRAAVIILDGLVLVTDPKIRAPRRARDGRPEEMAAIEWLDPRGKREGPRPGSPTPAVVASRREALVVLEFPVYGGLGIGSIVMLISALPDHPGRLGEDSFLARPETLVGLAMFAAAMLGVFAMSRTLPRTPPHPETGSLPPTPGDPGASSRWAPYAASLGIDEGGFRTLQVGLVVVGLAIPYLCLLVGLVT